MKNLRQIIFFLVVTIVDNQIIGVIGDSGTGQAHLHLNRYERIADDVDYLNGDSDAIGPLEVISHTGPEYNAKILKRDNQSNTDNFKPFIESIEIFFGV